MRSDEQSDRTHLTGSPLGSAGEPRSGAVLAERYEVQAKLADDPIAIEYVAFDQETEKDVLLRVVRPELFTRESDRKETFERIEATLGIAGRYLPGLNDVDIEGRWVFTIEPWPPGTTFRDVIQTRAQKGERFGPSEVLPVIARVAAAIKAIPFPLHHGEIRAERVYIDPERLRVTGPFLLHALPPGCLTGPLSSNERLRRTLAPESNSGSGPAADGWGIACLALEALTGALPPSETAIATLGPIGVEIGRLLHPDPALRPASVNPLLSALSEACSLPIPDLDPGALRKPRRPRRAAAAPAERPSDPPDSDDGQTRRVPATDVMTQTIDEADTPIEASLTASALISGSDLVTPDVGTHPSERPTPRESFRAASSDTQRSVAPETQEEERSTDKRVRVDPAERSPGRRAPEDERTGLPLPAQPRMQQLWPSLINQKDDRTEPRFEPLGVLPTERNPALDPDAAATDALLDGRTPPSLESEVTNPRFGPPVIADTERNPVIAEPSIPRFPTEERKRRTGEPRPIPSAPPVLPAEAKAKKPLPRAPKPPRPQTPFTPSPDIKPIPKPKRTSMPSPAVKPGDVLFDDSAPVPVALPLPTGPQMAQPSPLPPPIPNPGASTPPPRPPPTPMAGSRKHRNLMLAESTTAPRAIHALAPLEPPASSAARWLILLIALLLAAIILGVGYYVKLQRDRETAQERLDRMSQELNRDGG